MWNQVDEHFVLHLVLTRFCPVLLQGVRFRSLQANGRRVQQDRHIRGSACALHVAGGHREAPLLREI